MNVNKLLSQKIRKTDHENNTTESEVYDKIQVEQQPSFIKLFTADIAKLHGLPKKTSGFLMELIERSTWKNEVILNAAVKRQIAEKIGISKGGLDVQIFKLIQAEIISRIDTGIFMLNPNLFARGEWSDIKQLRNQYLEINITYKNNHREIKASIKPDQDH